MKTLRGVVRIAFATCLIPAIRAEDFLDQVEKALTFSTLHDSVRRERLGLFRVFVGRGLLDLGNTLAAQFTWRS
jgi:hypothetical protein